jgi:hypothetical protein
VEEAMHCEHGDGVHASLMTTKSLTSDNAARATSRAVIDLQQKQAAELRMLSDEALRQAPKRMEHAARTWLGMTPEQRKVVEDGTGTSECGCIGHSSNLTVEASVKTTEKVVLEANIVRDLAVNVIQRAMWNCPKKKKKHFFIKKLTATASVGDSGGPTPCAFGFPALATTTTATRAQPPGTAAKKRKEKPLLNREQAVCRGDV